MLAYIAGPIDVADQISTNWRHLVAIELSKFGIICYLPYLGWLWDPSSSSSGQQIILANESILSMADVLVADLDFRSVGTIREVQMATSLGIPVIARPSNSTRSPYAKDERIVWVEKVDDAVAAVRSFTSTISKNPRNTRGPLPVAALDVPPLLISLSAEATPPRRAYPTSVGMDLVDRKSVV